MRGYHIRIQLSPSTSPSGPSSSSTSTSYKHKQASSISTALSATPQPFVPSSLFQPLPPHPPRFLTRRNTLSAYNSPSEKEKQVEQNQSDRRDYRFGPIRVDWLDFSHMDAPGSSFIKVGSGKEKEKPAAQRRGELVQHLQHARPRLS